MDAERSDLYVTLYSRNGKNLQPVARRLFLSSRPPKRDTLSGNTRFRGVDANSAQLSFKGPSYGPFCPKFRCHGNGNQSGINTNDTVKLADPENRTVELKITTLSYT